MSETAQQLGAERATAAGCFVSFRLAERYGGRRIASIKDIVWPSSHQVLSI